MSYIEKSGKTVEDAIQAGLKELGKEIGDVTIEVLEEGSPGLFGLFGKLARVKITVKEQESDFDFEMPVFSLDQQAARKTRTPRKAENRPAPRQESPKTEEKPAQPKAEEKVSQPKAEAKPAAPAREEEKASAPAQEKPQSQHSSRQGRQRKARTPRPEQEKEPMTPASTEDLPPMNVEDLSADGKNAYEFLKELTHLMNVEVEIRIQEKENHMQVQMLGDTLGVLIGRRGDTLDALQYLTSLQVNKNREEYLRVTLDTEHYRAKREEALRRLAERMANRTRRTGHRVALEPMNPYERRVLHSALQDSPYVTTHSEGEEPYRRVVITLK